MEEYNNGRMVKVGMTAVCLLILFGLIMIHCSGCNESFTWPWQKPKQLVNPPTPAQQLWHTVTKSNWLVTLAIPIIALGAVAMFNGAAKLGMSAIIFGCVNLFMALATARFALWMSIFGLIGSVTAVAASILSKNKALKEFVLGLQNYRKSQVENDDLDICLSQAQKSKSTRKLVQDIKTNLKLKGEI